MPLAEICEAGIDIVQLEAERARLGVALHVEKLHNAQSRVLPKDRPRVVI